MSGPPRSLCSEVFGLEALELGSCGGPSYRDESAGPIAMFRLNAHHEVRDEALPRLEIVDLMTELVIVDARPHC